MLNCVFTFHINLELHGIVALKVEALSHVEAWEILVRDMQNKVRVDIIKEIKLASIGI